MKARLIAIMVGGSVLAACSSGGGSAPVVPAASTSAIAAISTSAFVNQAASAALYAVEAAKLAEMRSGDDDLRALAREQAAAGEAIAGQLRFAGSRVNAVPTNNLTPEHAAMLEALRSANDFDATYRAQQEELVPAMRRFHQQYATIGGSATLRPVASFSAEKMEAQEEALDDL